jgi:Na+/melibiose symporter-like transporter
MTIMRKLFSFILVFLSGCVLARVDHRVLDSSIVGFIFFTIGSLFFLFIAIGMAALLYYDINMEDMEEIIKNEIEKRKKDE